MPYLVSSKCYATRCDQDCLTNLSCTPGVPSVSGRFQMELSTSLKGGSIVNTTSMFFLLHAAANVVSILTSIVVVSVIMVH